jgi:hypothetical protein
LADIIADPIYPDAYRLAAAETFIIKQISESMGLNYPVMSNIVGETIPPDGGYAQYGSLIAQYSNEKPGFAGYIARAHAKLGF